MSVQKSKVVEGYGSASNGAQGRKNKLKLDLSPFLRGNTITGTFDVRITGTTCDRYNDGGSSGYWANKTFSLKVDGQTLKQYSNPGGVGTCSDFDSTYRIPIYVSSTTTIVAHDDMQFFGPTMNGSGYTDWIIDNRVPMNCTITAEVPYNLRQRNSKIYDGIWIDFDMLSQNKVYCTVYVNDVLKVSRASVSGRSYMIPHGTIKSKSDKVKVVLKSELSFLNDVIQSDEAVLNLSGLEDLKVEKPSNFRLLGTQKAIEEPIKVKWDMEDTTHVYDIQVWQNGYVIKEINGHKTSTLEYTLPAMTLKTLDSIQFKVRSAKTINGYSAYSDWVNLSVSGLTSIKPVITDFSLSGNNNDYPITITPNATGADYYSIHINGPSYSSQNLTIPAGTIKTSSDTITLYAIVRNSEGLEVKASKSKDFSFICNEPYIYSLEPSELAVNIEQPSTVSWATNEFIDTWVLKVNSLTYASGTNEKSIPIPPNTFKKGTNKLELICTYTPSYAGASQKNISRVSTFTGYGKPSAPKHDTSTVYNTANPTFRWDVGGDYGDDQTIFEIKIVDKDTSSTIETKVVVGSNQDYTMVNSLENNKQYTVSVSIKNKYNLWSDWSSKDITTNFNSLPIPEIVLSNTSTAITLKVSAIQPEDFREVKIYRCDDVNQDWICIANDVNINDTIVDYVPRPNAKNYYKARLYDTSGSYSESIVYDSYFSIKYYNIASVLSIKDNIVIKSALSNFVPSISNIVKTFAGNKKPRIFKNKSNYVTGTMSCILTNEQVHAIEKIINDEEVFCYRDWRGRKLYCFICITGINYTEDGLNDVSLQLTEIDFKEDGMFSGKGYKKIVYLNGQYMLDGSIDMSGYALVGDKREVISNAFLY